MGTSACLHLARRGRRVLGLDRFDIPNRRASHHGRSRMIRLAYFEHPDYVALLRRAYENWRALERDAGRELLHVTGGLYLGPPDSDLVAGSGTAAREHGLAHEILEPSAVRRRWPVFRVADDWVGFWEPEGGFLVPEDVVKTQAELAVRHGAELHTGEPVVRWESRGDAFSVRTERAEYEAGSLVLTAGPWTASLAAGAGLPLTVTRQILAWFASPDLSPFAPGTFPCFAIDSAPRGAGRGLFYGFPVTEERRGFKVARHFPGERCDPDEVDRDARPGETDALREDLRRWLPGADGPIARTCVCLYTNTPDGHFIVDRFPESERVFVATGFSGHGFKFASVIGEALADLVTEGRTDLPIGFLGLARFS